MAYSCARWHCTGGEGEGGRDTVNEDKPLKKGGMEKRKRSVGNKVCATSQNSAVAVLWLMSWLCASSVRREMRSISAQSLDRHADIVQLKFGKKKEK